VGIIHSRLGGDQREHGRGDEDEQRADETDGDRTDEPGGGQSPAMRARLDQPLDR